MSAEVEDEKQMGRTYIEKYKEVKDTSIERKATVPRGMEETKRGSIYEQRAGICQE